MNNPLISIIIPVYNVEKYLRRCLDSILTQSYTNWEAILIDDGSKDSSGVICDEYAKKDNRYVVVHKENEGVSAARNCGISISKGEYITFIDSDDWYGDMHIEHMMNYCNNPLVITGFQRVGTLTGLAGPNNTMTVKITELPTQWNDFGKGDTFYWFIWNKLFKSDVIWKNNILFSTTVKYLEDFSFVLDYMNVIDCFALVNTHDYYHLYESNKYSKYLMDFSQMKKHWECNSESLSVLESRCGKTNKALRLSLIRRHVMNFARYMKTSPGFIEPIHQLHKFNSYYRSGCFICLNNRELLNLYKNFKLWNRLYLYIDYFFSNSKY